MGLDIYLTNAPEKPSEKYPEHHCNRAYLRSSYNSAGFNTVVRRLTGKDLYWVFNPRNVNEEGYIIFSERELKEAKKRALSLVKELKAIDYPLGVTYQDSQSTKNYVHIDDVISLVNNELEKYKKGGAMGDYASSNGKFFFRNPLKVVALLPGKSPFGYCVWVVYEMPKDVFEYYIQTAEITVEFIEEALLQEIPAVVVWSG